MNNRNVLIKLLLLSVIILMPISVNATGGGLRKNSIKTCPNGITYGMHSDGHGGTHWHVAVTNGNNYYSSGDAIYQDPCPNSTKNDGSAGETSNNNHNTTTRIITTTTIKKSDDVSLKEVIVDNEKVEINDEMNYEVSKKNVDIKVYTNDSKASVEILNKDLIIGNNVIEIKVKAENGNEKTYKLNLTRKEVKSNVKITRLTIGSGDVEFDENNKSTIKKLKNETTLEYSYTLSDVSAKLVIYHNDKEVTKLDNLKDKDIIKFVVVDKDENENTYSVIIEDSGLIFSVIVYGLTTLIMLSPIIALVIVLIYKRRKKTNNNNNKI